MTCLSQNRPIITFHIKGLFRANDWTASLTICQLYFSKRKRIGRFSVSFGQNFRLCFNKSVICMNEASTVGLVMCTVPHENPAL